MVAQSPNLKQLLVELKHNQFPPHIAELPVTDKI